MVTKSITVEITFEEDQDLTTATATMQAPNGSTLRAHGRARRNPTDPPAPKIGEEVASARAFSQLAYELLETAATDIEDSLHKPAHLRV